MCGYKQARRRDNDTAIVNAGMKVLLEVGTDQDQWLVKELKLAYAGVNNRPLMATKTQQLLTGK